MNERIYNVILFIPVLSFIYCFLFLDEQLLVLVTSEDGAVENISALCFGLSVIYCIYNYSASKNRIGLLIWAVLCFVFLGEETSWFQRYIGYSVPFVESFNSQGEFNLHNLDIFQSRSLLEADFDLKEIISSQNIFRIGFLFYFLIFPIMLKVFRLYPFAAKLGYRATSNSFIAILWFSMSVTILFSIFSASELRGAVAECREFMYAFFISAYVIRFLNRAD